MQAVEKAAAAGLIVVTSAGNYGQKQTDGDAGYAGITSPGNAPSAITVGAADTQNTIVRGDDAVASYSSRGPILVRRVREAGRRRAGAQLAADTTLNSYLYKLLPSAASRRRTAQECSR